MARPKTRHIASLDGLRSFAVLAVIAYHLGCAWAPGGLLGVTVFFVLSGYLITGLLVGEFRASATIDLPQFWLRRVRRLVPAIVTVIVVTCALCALFNHVLLTKMRPDIVPSLLFYSNWWQILRDVSYFEAQGAPSPLQHFWSLAIEEQFYLVWPVLLLALFRRRVKTATLRRGILAAALLSAVAMALLYDPASDPSRVYYGTDTRALSLLIGAWLAIAWPSSALGGVRDDGRPAAQASPQAVRVLDVVGVVAFAGLVALVLAMDGSSAFPYRGGILLCSVLTALVIAAIVHPASLFARFWALPPLVWMGERSYGMYLWHFPILLLMTDQNATEAAPLWWVALELALIVGVSAASYAFIENPVRKGRISEVLRGVREGSVSVPGYLASHAVPGLAAVAVVGVAVVGCIVVPPTSLLDQAQGDVLTAEEADERSRLNAEAAAQGQTTYDVLMIGDSVSARCENAFEDYFPDGCLDAAVGRSMEQGSQTYARYRDKGVVGQAVVVALGTNGLVTAEQVEDLVANVGPDKQLWLVNVRTKADWADKTNEALAQAAESHDNVGLVDWSAYSAGNDYLFDGDGEHLTAEAAEDYLALIKAAVDGGMPTAA